MINQNESPFYTEEAFQCQRMHKRILETFPICRVYQAHIPSYPSGHWLFGFASKKYHPLDDLDKVGWKAERDTYKILRAQAPRRSICAAGLRGGFCWRMWRDDVEEYSKLYRM